MHMNVRLAGLMCTRNLNAQHAISKDNFLHGPVERYLEVCHAR